MTEKELRKLSLFSLYMLNIRRFTEDITLIDKDDEVKDIVLKGISACMRLAKLQREKDKIGERCCGVISFETARFREEIISKLAVDKDEKKAANRSRRLTAKVK